MTRSCASRRVRPPRSAPSAVVFFHSDKLSRFAAQHPPGNYPSRQNIGVRANGYAVQRRIVAVAGERRSVICSRF